MIPAILMTAQLAFALPDAVRTELDAACSGWRFAAVLPEIAEEIRTRTPSWPANVIFGDFNTDKQTDMAALIDCRGLVQLVVFVSSEKGLTKDVLEKPQPHDPRQFLHLIRQEYGRDAIGVEYEAIGGHAWVLRDGRWQSMTR